MFWAHPPPVAGTAEAIAVPLRTVSFALRLQPSNQLGCTPPSMAYRTPLRRISRYRLEASKVGASEDVDDVDVGDDGHDGTLMLFEQPSVHLLASVVLVGDGGAAAEILVVVSIVARCAALVARSCSALAMRSRICARHFACVHAGLCAWFDQSIYHACVSFKPPCPRSVRT